MIVRIFADIIIFLVAILFPGWSFFVLGSVASYFFAGFYELLFISFVVDVLYGFPISGWYGFRFVFVLLASLVVLVMEIFRKRVRAF